jgi:uncharacterized protein GlcG (DUF336 family)
MTPQLQTIGLDDAQTAIAAGMAMANRYGRAMAFVVADREGELIAAARASGCRAGRTCSIA